MPSAKTIADLKTKFLKPALTSQYEVTIPLGSLPEGIKSIGGGLSTLDQADLNLSCMETSLPGSSLATFEVRNDYTGVTERLAHRRMYDDRIDFTFLVDAEKYFAIRIFEKWMRYIAGEDANREDGEARITRDVSYHYRIRYPGTGADRTGYRCLDGLKITKFEKDMRNSLTYEFIGAYPIAISSMPVSYESSSLLKCTVSMSYLRYVMTELISPTPATTIQPQATKADKENTQELPVAQQKASDVIQNTGPEGEGLYDSATGERMLSTEQQIIEQGRVGDRVTPALAAELQAFADGR
jgi:hypothetical protein